MYWHQKSDTLGLGEKGKGLMKLEQKLWGSLIRLTLKDIRLMKKVASPKKTAPIHCNDVQNSSEGEEESVPRRHWNKSWPTLELKKLIFQ